MVRIDCLPEGAAIMLMSERDFSSNDRSVTRLPNHASISASGSGASSLGQGPQGNRWESQLVGRLAWWGQVHRHARQYAVGGNAVDNATEISHDIVDRTARGVQPRSVVVR